MRLTRLVRLAAGLLALVVCVVLAAPTASAGPKDRKKKVDSSISQLKDDLEDTSADLSQAYAKLQDIQKQLTTARAALVAAQAEVDEAKAKDAEVGRRLAVAQADEQKALASLAATTKQSKKATATVGGIARQAYQTGGMGQLSVALSARSADDFATRVVLVDTAMRIQGDTLASLAAIAAETAATEARLAAVRGQIAALKVESEASLAAAKDAEAKAAAAKARVDGLLADQQAQVTVFEQRKTAEKKRLDALEAERRKLEKQLAELARQARLKAARNHQNGGSTNSNGFLSRPVNGGWISSEFGRRFHPILHYWRLHAGMDFAVPCGTPVRAAASGTVVSAGWGGGYGNRVVINNGYERGVGLSTTYNHLSRIVVHGGHVSRGELIAYSGTTGSSTGCHLHFETYENGTPVNPRRWL